MAIEVDERIKLPHTSTSTNREAVVPDRWLSAAMLVLGVGLAVNTVLGPLVLDAVRYPFSESMRNQTIGLEAVSLVLVAPLCVAAGVLLLRGRRLGAVMALGPAAYAAYMFMQYLVGPIYAHVPRVLPLHLGLFVVAMAVAVRAWASIDPSRLPATPASVSRRRGLVLCGLAAFIVSRYLPVLAGSWGEQALPSAAALDPAMFWSILWLDLGLVVPATVAAAVGLFRGASWAGKAMYGVLGWFALVPPSVAAMNLAMVANDDPNTSVAQMVVLIVVAMIFAGYAFGVYRPLLGSARESGDAA